MSAFDAGIALSQDELNQAVGVVYQKLYPHYFTGSQNVNQMGIQRVEWNIATAPQFNLSASSAQRAGTAVASSLWAAHGAANTVGVSQEDVHTMVGESLPTFEIDIAEVTMTLVPDSGSPKVINLTGVKANCFVQVAGNKISIVPQEVTADPVSDPTDEFFVKLVILPELKSNLQTLLSGLTIPSFDIDGVALSYPSIAIVDNHIVAAANIAAKGTPPPAASGSWTSSGFSLLLSQDLLQAGAASQGKTFGDSGSGGSHWAGYDWHYSLSLVNPQISINGTDLDITFSLSGSVGATAYIVYIPIGLSFDASAKPNPTAVCTIEPSNGKVTIVTKSVSPFVVLVTPSGSIPSKVAGWMVEGIVQAVVASVSPLISQFMGGITFASMDIPTYTENASGITITMTPSNLSVSNVNGYLALGGDLTVS